MSGRDLRTFVNFHRDAIGASDPSLVSRLVHGKNAGRYKEADYEKLKAITRLKNASGLQSLKKIETIHQLNKEKQDFNTLQQHKTYWKRELNRLNSLYRSKDYELELAQTGLPWEQSSVKEFFDEVKEYENFIKNDYVTFSNNTIKPVWDLREDIQVWLEENKQQIRSGEADPSQVSHVLESVKLQQERIMVQLGKEQAQVENDPVMMNVHELIQTDDEDFHIETGIPEEATVLTCPYPELKTSILNEFELLDRRYETHLNYLKLKYRSVLENKDEDWAQDDRLHFEHILGQYPADIPNRRSLYIDRMIRELPHMTRRMIVEHEEWWFALKSYQSQEVAVFRARQKDRCDLLLKVKATFTEAWNEYENEKIRIVNRKRQDEICRKLHQKVEDFQQQKLEAFNLQQQINEKMKKEELEQLEAENEREKKRREFIHTKVKHYKERKTFEAKMKLEEEKQRLAEIQKQMEEQAKKDAERVAFRENELKKRQEAKRHLHQEHLEEQEEMERRLEKLREQVCVNVAADPLRILQTTEASRAHAAKSECKQLELQKPLFSINTFNTLEITSDPRHKVEQALRNAGLNHTDYARQVLANVKPLRPTRPDQQSSLFKE